MNSKAKGAKKTEVYCIPADAFIERMRKIRALNCSPSDVGIESYITRQFIFNKSDTSVKIV